MGLKINRNDDNKIVSLQTNDGVFSFAYLVEPRPESDFKAGHYGTDFVTRDPETLKAIKEYLNEVIQTAVKDVWENKMPKEMLLPLKKGDEASDLTKGAYVLKTHTKHEPKVYIRNESGRALEVTPDEFSDIYSGMIGEVVIKFSAYSYGGNKGITAYLSAACKTANGTPLGSKGNYEDDFSIKSDFDSNDFDSGKKDEKKQDKENKEPVGGVDLDAMIDQGTKPPTDEPKVDPGSGDLSLDDIMKM